MVYQREYVPETLTRVELGATTGPLVLEFGTNWCGYCRAAQPLIEAVLADHPSLQHVKVEDGKGLPLGRSLRVKLWPTLIFLMDGEESARVVRPTDEAAVREALATLTLS